MNRLKIRLALASDRIEDKPYLADSRHRECKIVNFRQRRLVMVLAMLLPRRTAAFVPFPLTVTSGRDEARLKYVGIKFSGITLADTAVALRATAKGATALMPFIVMVGGL